MQIAFVAPIVCINGTHREELLEERMKLANAVRDALKALKAAAPNARDHQGVTGRFDRAVNAHVDRREALEAVLTSVTAELELVSQMDDQYAR